MTKAYLFDLLRKTWERDITADEAMSSFEEEFQIDDYGDYIILIND